jgi:thymidylate synthase (FAD)
MRTTTHPTVYLVGRPQIDMEEVQRFLDAESTAWITDGERGSELLSELAGRVCYLSFGARQGRKSIADYLRNIIELEHGSVLEHAVWNFIVTGVSRSFSHEMIRHRAGWAYSQLSQRYVDESDTDFVVPEIVDRDPELRALWEDAVGQAHAAYQRLADGLAARIEQEHPEMRKRNKRIAARQAARSVLPNATETKVFFSANARALRHFVEYRGAEDAEPEIRRVAVQVLGIMQAEAPNIFGDYETYELADGSCAVRTEHKKV